jgi:ribosome-binding protein aMBF1 (putative translation factor)
MSNDLEEKFVSDDGVSSVPSPVTPAGGEIKKRRADVKKAVHPKAEKVTMAEEEDLDEDSAIEEEAEEISIEESVAAIFEGMDLSEDFKAKATMVFEAAVNEAASAKAAEIAEQLEEEFEVKLTESVNEAMEEIVENLDSYLDYIVSEWMEENAVAIESGIKVEMAESFMEGLKTLFAEHNVEIDEETVDVVAALEEQVAELEETANGVINENIELAKMVASLQADQVFNEISEGLTVSQKERLRVLSEKLDVNDLDEYASDLSTLKESFFKKKSSSNVIAEETTADEPLLTEETAPASGYSSVDAIVKALNSRAFK